MHNILGVDDLLQKLEAIAELTEIEKNILLHEWHEGAQAMFQKNHLVTFRDAFFNNLDKVVCEYIDFDEVNLDKRIYPQEAQAAFESRLLSSQFDVFISHASEDKESLVRPLANKLREMGFAVFFDENQIKVGTELKQVIDSGIRQSQNAIVILSPHFIDHKEWTHYELEELTRSGKRILPIWHQLNKDQEQKIKALSPAIKAKLGLTTDNHSIEELALKLAREMI